MMMKMMKMKGQSISHVHVEHEFAYSFLRVFSFCFVGFPQACVEAGSALDRGFEEDSVCRFACAAMAGRAEASETWWSWKARARAWGSGG